MYTNTNANAICFIETMCAKTTMCVHLLNFFFRYDNMMIKKNHKANILIEVIVIKQKDKRLEV